MLLRTPVGSAGWECPRYKRVQFWLVWSANRAHMFLI